MQDRQNARLMGMKPTGNGRRESYASMVMPRMTNTYMLAGDKTPEEILASVKKGIYATNFGGGQVDITNGKFVFTCTEAYLLEDGSDIRIIQELLGRTDVSTTMNSTPVLTKGGPGVRSPGDAP